MGGFIRFNGIVWHDVPGENMKIKGLPMAMLTVSILLGSCGDAPLAGIGDRSSDWISDPTILTTTTVAITIPMVVDSRVLKWFNDSIESGPLSDRQLLRDEIFARRGSDLIVQANRQEIAVLAPSIEFPAISPASAEYVTSQVVFDRNGSLSDEPAVGFGFWSSEPYTRSRSVAQLAVLWVSRDALGSQEAASVESGVSCARFSDASTISCDLNNRDGTPTWELKSSTGRTWVWFDGIYRYELFMRNSVPEQALINMVASFEELARLNARAG